MEYSELYKTSGIEIDQSWQTTIENSNHEIVQSLELTGTSLNSDDRELNANDDGFCEID